MEPEDRGGARPEQDPTGQPPYAPGGHQQPYAPPYPGAGYGQGRPLDPSQVRLLASAAHWGALVAGVVSSATLAWLVPLAIMLLKGEDPVVRRNAVESLNFQITCLIWGAVAVLASIITLGLAIPLVVAVGLWWLVLTIVGAVRVNNGEDYRYPLALRFVS